MSATADLARRLHRLDTRLATLERSNRALRYSAVRDGSIKAYDGEENLRGQLGERSDGTYGIEVINSPASLPPSTPQVSGVLAGIEVAWDGLLNDGNRPDQSVVKIDVWVALAAATMPEDPGSWMVGSILPGISTVTATTTAAGGSLTYPSTAYGTPLWVRLVAVNAAGVESYPSVAASGTPAQATSADLPDQIITAAKLADAAVTTVKLAEAAVAAGKIAVDAIQPVNIAPNAVTTPKLAIGAVTAPTIGDAAITTAKIAGLAVDLSKLAAGSVDASKLLTDAVTAPAIAAGAVAASELAANSVIAGKIAADAVTAATIAAGAVTAGKVAADAITANEIAANAITASELSALAVTAGKIAANAVTAGTIAANAVTAGTIAANAVTANEISAGAITTAKIAAGAVTATEIAAGSVTATKMVAGTITAASGILADAVITTAKIGDAQVLSAKIADAAITTAKIGDAQITSAKIASLSADKITAGTISASVTVSGRLATALTGPRVELNATGIRVYKEINAAQVQTFAADINGDVTMAGTLQSLNFTPAETGFRFGTDPITGEQTSQVESLNVIGTLGANTVSTEQVMIGGDDLSVDLLPSYSKGMIAYGSSSAMTVDSAAVALNALTEVAVVEFAMGQVYSQRWYQLICKGMVSGGVDQDQYRLWFRYTVDGSTPTLTSAVMDYSAYDILWPRANGRFGFTMTNFYAPGGDYANVRILLTLSRMAGPGGGYVELSDNNLGLQFVAVDMGLRSEVTNSIVQKSKYTAPTVAEDTTAPEPKQTYTKSWSATWSRSFDTGGVPRSPDTNDLYQGYYSSTHGNTRSMVGFLTGTGGVFDTLNKAGVRIKKVTLTYRVKHSYQNAGLRLGLGTHGETSRPSAFSKIGSDTTYLYDSGGANRQEGTTYTVTLTTSDTSSLSVGLKNGSIRGFTFGPGPDNGSAWYGYVYGYGSGSPPKLTVTYEK